MPLKKALRQPVVDYILRDIAPGKPAGQKPMEWFLDRFAFVDNATLQKYLAEAFYQARLIEKTREALGLRKEFNNVFVKTQILLYASIYESLIDYALEKNKTEPTVASLLRQEFFSPVPALSGATELTYKEAGATHKIVTCKKKGRTQKLKEIQFNDRLNAAVELGFVQASNQAELEDLYKSRNKIHILAAVADNYKPDVLQSSMAFRNLFAFLAHARAFFQPPNP